MATPDPEDRELVRMMFAKATAMLEDAAATAIEGQGARVSRAKVLAHARCLNADLEAIQGLVAAILVLADARRPAGRR